MESQKELQEETMIPKDKRRNGKTLAEKWIFFVCALFSIVAVFGIILFILVYAFPTFADTGFFRFIFGTEWDPSNGKYGILPMIYGSVIVSLGALVLGGALGVFVALFSVYWCPERLKKVFDQIINIFAGIPSVIYGLFGMKMLEPILRTFAPDDSGFGIMACWLILMIMILPTVAGMSKNALKSVPENYYEGAIALGATKEQAIFTVMLPAAKSGIVSGLIMGTGRAIGEAMAVIMVAGNVAVFPKGLFDNFRTMTTNIALEIAYADDTKRSALIATGFVLLLFVLGLNLCIGLVKRNKISKRGGTRKLKNAEFVAPTYKKKGLVTKILKYVSYVLSVFVIAVLVAIVLFIVTNGVQHISLDFLFGKSSYSNRTMAPAFVNTAMIILLSLGIALPIGICAAVYLNEYSKPGSVVVKVIRVFTDTLAGIPSIVFGLFGNIVFYDLLKLNYSLLGGSLTMALIILPTIIRSVEESLIAVPDSLREASFALGATKFRTLIKVVLPQALAGILTATVLSIGRIVGESAALIYTAGTSMRMPKSGYFSAGGTFAVLIYSLSMEGTTQELRDKAYAVALVLMIIVAIIYVGLGLLEHFGKNKGERKCKEKIKPKTA